MKRKNRFSYVFLTCMVAVMLLLSTVSAYAGDTDISITTKDNAATVSFIEGSREKLTVSYTGGQADKDYVLLVVKARNVGETSQTYDITQDAQILWMSQAKADNNNTVTFNNVFPMYMQDSVVLIAGEELTQPKLIAAIEVPVIRGDANGDGMVTAADITMMARHVAQIDPMDNNDAFMANCDFDEDNDVDAEDLTKIAKYVAGIIRTL